MSRNPAEAIRGHVIGVAAGSLVAAVIGFPSMVPMVEDSRLLFDSLAALTVGLSITLMVATYAECPPAAGAALGLVVHGWDLSSVGVILIGAFALSIIRMGLRSRLVNLL